jgi:hypothetical protein
VTGEDGHYVPYREDRGMETMLNTILEIVTFRLNDGVSDADFIAAGAATLEPSSKLPGFISRQLVSTSEGVWTDLVAWETMDHAKAAMEAFGSIPEANVYISLINMESLSLTHATVRAAHP